jgi:hypothetical protein
MDTVAVRRTGEPVTEVEKETQDPVQEDDRRRSPGTWRDRIYIQTA